MCYIEKRAVSSSTYSIGMYNYDRTNYVDSKTPVIITCPDHGDFNITPDNFIYRAGCPKCRGIHPRGYPARRNKADKLKPGRAAGELRLMLTTGEGGTLASLTNSNPHDRAVDLDRTLVAHAGFNDPSVARAARTLLNANPTDLATFKELLKWK